ncbi:MAG: magnesium transporter CorA family protein [Gaiellales bacterium]
MRTHLIDAAGHRDLELDRNGLEALRAGTGFYWLDLHGESDDGVELVGEVYGFHPLAIEDAVHFGQRPKAEEYDGYVFLVLYGAAPDADGLVEVHCFYSERYLITVRRDHCPAFAEARERQTRRPQGMTDPIAVLHRVVDGLVDSFFPMLAGFDELIDALEDAIAVRPDDDQLRRISHLKRRLVSLRRVIAPQRDLAASIASGLIELPGTNLEAQRSFRDVYDHTIRLTDQLDSYRDLVTGVMDIYLSTVSNRLNSVMKALTLIATIFLPLTFVSGFFGQNFGWMVRAVGGAVPFWVLGVGLQLGIVVALLALFRRRGWL